MGCPAEVTIGDNLTFSVCTHDPDTGVLTDADAVPTYRVYEDETATGDWPITGSMAKLEDDNTTGFYTETLECTSANGYEAGKTYTIYITAAVGSDTGGICYAFKGKASTTGPGDYSVTLTIRTTGGSALAGVEVWLNTSNTRSSSVVEPKYTDSNGQVTFTLDYTTYYIFCQKSGYTFAAASMTPASGSVSFTKDIATAVSVGETSNYENSFITRALDTVREAIDEPTVNKKYSDDRIIVQLEKSYAHILGEINRNTRTPVVGTYELTVNTGSSTEQIFTLPHYTGTIIGAYVTDDYGGKTFYDSRGMHNLLGRAVWVEGQTLKVQPYHIGSSNTGGTATLKVEHLPVGIARLHNGTLTLDADGDAATLGATPNAGNLDTHPSAYLGGTLRILEVDGTTVTGNVMQERTISAYNSTTRVATLSDALDPIPTTDDGNIYYEIAPTIHKGLDEIVATYTAYAMCLTEGNRKRADGILKRYQSEIRNIRLTAYYSKLDEATKQRADSYDKRRYPFSR